MFAMKIKLADMNTIGTPETLKKTFIKRLTCIYRHLLKKETFLHVTSSAIFLPAMWILPFFSNPEYSIINNTVGELGATTTPGALIINLLLITVSTGSMIAGWYYYQGYNLQRLILLTFCLSLLLSAIYNDQGINAEGIGTMEADWHTFFEATYTLSFILLCLATSFINTNRQEKGWSLIVALSAIIISVLGAETGFARGIFNRLLFSIMVVCLIRMFIKSNIQIFLE